MSTPLDHTVCVWLSIPHRQNRRTYFTLTDSLTVNVNYTPPPTRSMKTLREDHNGTVRCLVEIVPALTSLSGKKAWTETQGNQGTKLLFLISHHLQSGKRLRDQKTI